MTTATRIKLSDEQHDFVADQHQYAAFIGGIGSGKTHAGALKALTCGPGLGLVVAPTYPMLRDATWRTALAVWEPWIREINRAEMRITLHRGIEALFRSADDPDKLRGPNCRWAWIDEGAQCHADTWPVVIGRLREGGQIGRAWVTTTPKGFNWVHDVFVARASADTAIFRARTAANPFLDPRFVELLRGQYATEFARQELEGQFITLGAGLIKRSWFEIADHAPEGLRWARYWDLATSEKTSADFTASVRAARDIDGRLWLADMIRGRWAWPDARRVIVQTLTNEDSDVGIEKVGFQLAAVQEILAEPASFGRYVRGIPVDRDKVARAQPWIARAENRMVTLVRGAWINDFLGEAESFPEGTHDDQVDAVSGAVAMLTEYAVPEVY